MSIVALKRKTAAKYNNSSVGVPQFSINGGYRNQGWVGQTSLSRSIIKTPHRGATPRGHGGCCGTYNVSIVCPREPCTNNNAVIKKSSVSTDGMLDGKYRWIRRPAPYTSVKPDVNHNLNQQSHYIARVAKQTLNSTTRNCPPIPKDPCSTNCDLYKNTVTDRAGIVPFTKIVGPLCSKEYSEKLGDQCVSIDIKFQDKQNTKPASTPFGC
jgi:hypothetical protein